MKVLKIFIIILIGLFFLIFFFPSKPQPIDKVFFESCSLTIPNQYKLKNRSYSYSMAPHGVWYSENMIINVSKSLAENILASLKNNKKFELKDNYYEKFIAGKILTNCTVNTDTGTINIKYVLW